MTRSGQSKCSPDHTTIGSPMRFTLNLGQNPVMRGGAPFPRSLIQKETERLISEDSLKTLGHSFAWATFGLPFQVSKQINFYFHGPVIGWRNSN